MTTVRHEAGLAAVGGKLYVIGGLDPSLSPVALIDTVEEYDPIANTWTTKGARMPTARGAFGTAVLNGLIFAISGYGTWPPTLTNATDMYDPVGDAWSSLAPSPNSYVWSPVNAVGGKVYVMDNVKGDVFTPSLPPIVN